MATSEVKIYSCACIPFLQALIILISSLSFLSCTPTLCHPISLGVILLHPPPLPYSHIHSLSSHSLALFLCSQTILGIAFHPLNHSTFHSFTSIYTTQWNLKSQKPLTTNASNHKQIFQIKMSQVMNMQAGNNVEQQAESISRVTFPP